MAKASELSLAEMSEQVVRALEPDPKPYQKPPFALWRFTIHPGRARGFTEKPKNLMRAGHIEIAESILCQDPERKEEYGWHLLQAVSRGLGPPPYSRVADIATASSEQRLRAMHAAVCGGG